MKRTSPLDFHKLGQEITDKIMAEWEADLSQFDILRAPPPPERPTEGKFWPIYVMELSRSELKDTLLVIFWKGKWMYLGNLNSLGNWRHELEKFKAILEIAEKK